MMKIRFPQKISHGRLLRSFSIGGAICLVGLLFMLALRSASATGPTIHTFIIPVAADTEVNTHDYDKNYGGENEVKVLAESGGPHIHRPLFRYDLSSILPGSTVLTATVHFYVNNADNNPVNIHRVTVPWDENTVTYNSFNEGYFAGVEGTFTPSQENQFVSANITPLVQQWVNGLRHNRGLVLLPTTEKKDSKYATKEDNKLERVSYLEVVVDNSAIRTYADDFAPAGSFAGSDGGELWTSTWSELGESDGAAAGNVLVLPDGGCPDGACLRIGDSNGSLTGFGVRRAVDLSGAAAASLSFRYRREDAHAALHVEVSRNGGSTWHRLASIQLNHSDDSYGYATYDLSAYTSASTQIRLIGEQTGGNTDKGILIDDLRVAYLDSAALDSGIGDRVWDDLNRDFVQDVGEPGLADVVVDLYVGTCADVEPPAYRTTNTDENGDYFFPMLFAGQYCVVADDGSVPVDYAATGDTSLLNVTLATSQIYGDADFGYASVLADDRLSVGVYAPCTDITWLQTLAATNSATAINEDYHACTFTYTGTPANLDQLALDVAADNRDRNVVSDIWVSSAYLPNDPDFNNASLVYGPQQINAPAAWDVTTGSPNLIVAILDTGVNLTHPEFAGRLLPGYDFVNEDADPTDDNGHGTHVAGIVAAGINNALGMAGVAGTVKILPVKVLNAQNTGWWSDISQGITWAVDQGAKVINLSLAGTTDSTAMRDAISYANSRGALVVVAAGNSASSQVYYPASLENVVSLGGSSYTGGTWSLSNFGPNVDLIAPAALVWSTARGGGYQFMSGTSMAAPHAAGVAALVYSRNPNLDPDEVKQLFLDTATPMGDPNVTGAGLLNAGSAVASVPPEAPSPPVTSVETALVTDLSGNGIVDPGDTLRYNITVANANTSPVNNVVVSGTVPANTTYVSGSTKLNGIPTQDNATGTPFPLDAGGLNIGSIPASNSSALSFDVTVNPPTPVFNSLFNRSTVKVGGGQNEVEVTTLVGGDACTLTLKNDVGATITSLSVGRTLHLSLTDPDENTRATTLQSVTILVSNATTGDQEHLLLRESGPNTGVFTGHIDLSSVLGSAQDDGFLRTLTGNTVTVRYADPDFSPDTCAKTLTATSPGSTDLRVTQSVDDSTPDEEQSIVYTVKVRNNGPTLATSLVISAAAPAGVSYIVGSATAGEFDYDTGVWLVGQLPVGVEAVLTIDAEVSGESGTSIVNTTFVQAKDQSDAVPGNDSATTTLIVNPADLQVTKSVNISAPDEGEVVRYTVNVKNNGPAAQATEIVIRDLLPAGMTFVAATPAQGTFNSATGQWSVGSLASGSNVDLLLDARYTAGYSGRPITNTATVLSFGQTDSILSNNSASAVITPKTADLRVLKSVDNSGPLENQTIAYTIKVKNQGPAATASAIVISDVLPAGLTFASAVAQQGSYSSSTGLWNVGSLANGVEVALTLNATVNSGTSGQTITNRAAVVSFNQKDSIPTNDAATVPIIVAPADLEVTKIVDDNTPDEDQQIQYTVVVKNNGPSFANGIVIRDVLPATLAFVSVNADVGTYSAATGRWTLNTTLSVGQSKKMVIKAKPKAGTSGQTITNRAEIAAVNQLDDDNSNDAASVNVTVNTLDLQITKTVSDNTPDELQVIDYTVTVLNKGPSFASGIVISDVLPAGMEFVSANADVGTYDPVTGRWTLSANLSSGQSKKVVIKAKPLYGTSGQSFLNQAKVLAVDQVDTVAGNNSAVVSVAVNGVDIVISVDVDASKPGENQNIIYTVGVKNDGPAALAHNIVISSVLPSELTLVSADPDQGSYNPATGVWTVGSISSGQTKYIDITAYVPNSLFNQKLTYRAQLAAVDQFEIDAGDNVRSKEITVDDTDILVTKTIKNNLLTVYDLAEYTVQVTHNGPANNIATGIVIRDVLPAGVAFASASPDQGTYDPATGLWSLGSLTMGQSKKLTIKAVVQPYNPAVPEVTNTAALFDLDQHENSSGNNSASASFTYAPTDIWVDKKVSDGSPDEGDVIAFTIEARNYGLASKAGATIQDILPDGLSYFGSVADRGSYDPATGIWALPGLGLWNPDNPVKVTLTLSATVDAGTNGLALTNTATSIGGPDLVPTNNSDSVVVNVRGVDVRLTKTVDDDRPDESQIIVYTVSAKNNGPAEMNATNVMISDTLPAGLTFVSAVAAQGSYNPTNGLWSLGVIPKGVTYGLVINARVNTGTSGRIITNTATLLSYNQRDPDTSNNSAQAIIEVGTADLQMTKTVDDTSPAENQVVRYTVKVKNDGPSVASGVVISDVLPAKMIFVAASADQGSYNSGTGLWTVGTLADNATATLLLDARVGLGTVGQSIVNTASVHALNQEDIFPANDSASASLIPQTIDLRVQKEVNDATPDIGQIVVYTVKVRNMGPRGATGVLVRDILPASTSFKSASATQGSYNSGTGLWTVGSLASGVEKVLTLNAQVNAGTSGTTITNTATLHALDQQDNNALNNAASIPVTVNTADLRVTKVVNDPAPDEEQVIRYTIKVRNLGPGSAASIVISDLLPPGMIYKAKSESQGSYDRNKGEWTVGTLASGAEAQLTLDAEVNRDTSGQTIVNTASVKSLAQVDPNSANNQASAEVEVTKADVQITKSVDDAAPDEGDVVAYTVKVKNLGPSLASGVVAEDILPAGVTYVSHTAAQGVYDKGTGLWVIGDLASGVEKMLVINAFIDWGTSGTRIGNTARIRNVDQQDPNLSNNTATVRIDVRTADLRVLNSVNDTSPDEGQTIAYTVKVKNQGPSVATGIQVADVLPNGVSFVSAAPAQGSYDANTGIWTVGDLNSGVEKGLVINATVDAETGASTITNRAGVFAVDQADKSNSNDQATIALVVNGADLEISQSVDDATPAEGQTVRYTLTLVNRGPLDAANIVVTDRLPAGLTHQTNNSGGLYNPATGVWTVASLRKGDNQVLNIDARVNSGTRDSVIVNQAIITASSQPDSLIDNNYAEAKTAIGNADLNVSMSVDRSAPNEGDSVQFTVRVENRGPDSASDIEINFPLPPGLGYLSHSANLGRYNPATGIWTIDILSKPGVAAASADAADASSATLTLGAVVEDGAAATTIGATANIVGVDQNDPTAGNNQTTSNLIVHGADLSLTKSVNNLYPTIGNTVIYTVTLRNGGPDTATNVQVTDYWPSRVTFGSATPSVGSYNSATGKWTVPSLAASASATLRLSGVLAPGVESNIANRVEVTAADQPDGDSTPANHASSEDDYAEVLIFTGVPPAVDGVLDSVYRLSPDVDRVCYTSGGVLFAEWYVLKRPVDSALYTALVIDKEFVDNTYGTGAVGWSGGHSFGQLVGSDHASFIGYDANGVEVTDFNIDYISSGFATPSGYDTVGVNGGDGTHVLEAATSLAYNLNQLGYCADGDCATGGTNLLVNSPATDAFHTPNPTYPGWIYDVIYETKIRLDAFGPAGYGSLVAPYIHASPAKGSSNTIIATPGICPGEIGDYIWHDADTDGLQDEGENGIDGVNVSLYKDNGDNSFNQASDTLIGTKTTQSGGRYLFQDVEPGGYFVDVVNSSVSAGYSLNTNNDPTALITLAAGESYRDADFGYASLDFGDAPAPYPTLRASNGARHIVGGVTFLGVGVDSDADGQPGPTALGDDNNDGHDDEDGVVFNTALRQGQWSSLTVTASRSGRLNGWIDYAGNGNWSDASDHAIVDYPLVAGVNQIFVAVPADAKDGTTYARFRFSTSPGLSPTGEAPNGEVEDYRIEIDAPVGGVSGPGSVGDFVWHDQDGDGIQDPGEPAIPGVTVVITSQLGTRLTQVTTNTVGLGGNYTFAGLPAGTYTVTLDPATVPARYNFRTTPGQYLVSLTADENVSDADFGLKELATVIGDYIWYDADADGKQDLGEPGLGNITLDLYLDDGDGVFEPTPVLGSDTFVGSTVTDIRGGYRLDAPVAGGYFVDVTDTNGLLAGMVSTFGPQSITDPSPRIVVAQGQVYRDADFGYVRVPAPALIGDQLWLDGNGNGVYEPQEPVLIGVQVCATPIGGGAAICANTNLNGRYLLSVAAGSYSVTPAANPFGLTPTTPAPYLVHVDVGEQVLDADFGFNGNGGTLSRLGGTIWQDMPVNDVADGLYVSGSEPAIPNVSVNLIRDTSGNKIWEAGEPIMATLSHFGSGEYSFGFLQPGNYLVRVSDTLGVLRFFAATIAGPTPGADNNNQAQPYAVTLAAGQTNTTGDFGYREYDAIVQGTPPPQGVIGDQVWFDVDRNGIYSAAAGDKGVAGVTLAVRVSGASTDLATVTTGAGGQYAFTGLPLGATYAVRVTDHFGMLAGYAPTIVGPNPAQNDNSRSQPYAVTLGLATRNTTADFGYAPPTTRFSLTKQVLTPGPVRLGETISYSIRITNTGSTVITGLPLQDDFNSKFLGYLTSTIVPDSGPGSGPVGQLVWNDLTGTMGELAPGASIEVKVSFTGIADTSFEIGAVTVNSATVSGVIADPDGASGASPLFQTLLPPQSAQAVIGISNPTAVLLASSQVVPSDNGALITWQTISEVNMTGFNLLRINPDGSTTRLTEAALPAQKPGQSEGASYSWVDSSAQAGQFYTYLLEVIGLDGFTEQVTLGQLGGMRLFLPSVVR